MVSETFLGFRRARSGVCLLVGEESSVDRSGDPTFQRSEGYLVGFAFSYFLVEGDPAWGIGTDLSDRGLWIAHRRGELGDLNIVTNHAIVRPCHHPSILEK